MARLPSRRTSKFTLSPEEREQRRDAASAQLTSAVASLTTSDAFRAALRAATLFPEYSFGNTLMIGSQKPEATKVCGFHTWKKLGRSVKKGEKGIRIFIPIRGASSGARDRSRSRARSDVHADPLPAETPRTSDEELPLRAGGTRVRFMLGSVFDVTQTEGQPLPEFPTPKILDGDTPLIRAAIAGLCDYNAARGIPVSFTKLPGMPVEWRGFWSPSERCIEVRESLPPLQRLRTLAHETTHGRLHLQPAESQEERCCREVEAEATAYLVLESLGINGAEDYTFPYVAYYAKTPERLLGVAERARITAAAITDAMYHTMNQQLGTAFARGRPLDALLSNAEDTMAPAVATPEIPGLDASRVTPVEDPVASQRPAGGLFIVVEGVDGVGKTAVIPFLADHLRQTTTRPVVCVREPGGTPTGDTIRTDLKAGVGVQDPREQLAMFCTARQALINEVVRPALTAGSIVIADRHTLSSYVYQGGDGVPEREIAAANAAAVGDVQPDATVVLWATRAELAARRSARNAPADAFDAAAAEGMDRALARQARYIALADRTPGAVTVAVQPTPLDTASAIVDRIAHLIRSETVEAGAAATDTVDADPGDLDLGNLGEELQATA